MHKLRKFGILEELEPIELEKRMLQEYDDNDDDQIIQVEHNDVDVSQQVHIEDNVDELITKIFNRSSPRHQTKIPGDMKKLVLDIMAEEKLKSSDDIDEAIVNKVCKRLDSWKEVESNTIDMMVELDLRREGDVWRSYIDEVAANAEEIERAIFGLLVEELVL